MKLVTGSFGYIGKYITSELIDKGYSVKTITTHPNKPNPFGEKVKAFNYNFDNPSKLIEILEGCDVLFNTYWVRFNYRSWTFEKALENTKILFECAKKAQVKKIVQISVTNCTDNDELPYYRGKALQEKILKESGINHTIIRPTLVFGKEDILVNNIAWTIRRFPIIPIFGSGDYKLQPIYVEDLARLVVESCTANDSLTIDAVGPEIFTYKEFLCLIAKELNRNVYFQNVSPSLGILLGKVIGLFVKDVILTKDELKGLMANKLTSSSSPNGNTLFSEWLHENQEFIGTEYTSELERHFYWKSAV